MSKLKIGLLFSLILIISLVVFSVSRIQPQNKVFNYNELSPSDIVKLYWVSAVEGNEEILKQITTVTPSSFHNVCQENGQGRSLYGSGGNLTKENSVSLVEKETFKSSTVINPAGQSNTKKDKFLKETLDDSPLSLAYNTARYLYVSKISITKMNVKNEIVLNDESIVEVEYSIADNTIFQRNFYLINQKGWKIFYVVPSEATVDNKYFAMPRPRCEFN